MNRDPLTGRWAKHAPHPEPSDAEPPPWWLLPALMVALVIGAVAVASLVEPLVR